jgi:hypothetical protein
MRSGIYVVVGMALALTACGRDGEQGVGAPNGDILANSLVPAEAGARPDAPSTDSAPTGGVAGESPVEAWLGRWDGPEGLFLNIAPHRSGLPLVQLTIRDNLDSTGTRYPGEAEGATIRFTRGGAEQTIRPGTGAETGFKWLATKKNCLIIVPGKEGYCRD